MEIVCVLIIIILAEWKICSRLDKIIELLQEEFWFKGK